MKISPYVFFTLVIVAMISCNVGTEKPATMHIRGKIENFPYKKIYITDAHKWQTDLDSLEIKGGHFDWLLDSTIFPTPFLASIYYYDPVQRRRAPLLIKDYIRTKSTDKFSYSSFMLSYGTTELSGDFNNASKTLDLTPNEENDMVIANKVSLSIQSKQPAKVEQLIKDHPQSYFLLYEINNQKNLYSKKDLLKFLDLFDKKVLKAKAAQEIISHANYLVDDNQLPAEILFRDASNESQNVLKSKKLKMIIYWASWCSPCRAEIPHLKEIRRSYDTSKLTMVSVSIDADIEKWKTAMAQEKMQWEQLHVPEADLPKINSMFRFTSIPHVVFVNENNSIVKEFDGFFDDNLVKYKTAINENQKK